MKEKKKKKTKEKKLALHKFKWPFQHKLSIKHSDDGHAEESLKCLFNIMYSVVGLES